MTTQTEIKETYEQQREREQMEGKALAKRLDSIIKELGYIVIKDPERSFSFVTAKGLKSIHSIFMRANNYQNKGKIEVCFYANKDRTGKEQTGLKSKPDNIHVSLSKSDDQIIKDIKRRTDTAVLAFEFEIQETNTKNEKRQELRNNVLRTIEKALKSPESPKQVIEREKAQSSYTLRFDNEENSTGEGYDYIYGHFKVSYSGDNVSAEIRSLTIEQAEKLAAFVKIL